MRCGKMLKGEMRLIAYILATFVACSPAAAQSWMEYSYPDFAFTVSFPAEPRIETTVYQAADGRSMPARVYSVALDKGVFKITVVDLTTAALQESTVIDHAIKTLSQGGEIKLDIPTAGCSAAS
jgi:hypothetical protein